MHYVADFFCFSVFQPFSSVYLFVYTPICLLPILLNNLTLSSTDNFTDAFYKPALHKIVDIDIETYCIDTAQIEAAITPATKVIMPVHEFGLMADMAPILEIAERHNLLVIEDSACALGASDSGMLAGTGGDFGSLASLGPRPKRVGPPCKAQQVQ